jgi:ribonuclease T2
MVLGKLDQAFWLRSLFQTSVNVSGRPPEKKGAATASIANGGIIDSMSGRIVICLALTLALSSCGARPEGAPQAEARESQSAGRHRRQRGGEAAGRFDFYVMSLSWSPGFCATAAGRNDAVQCGPGRRFAFVLHGLWPQYERGGWPRNCSSEAMDETLVNSMLNIMPSPKLVAHEWEKHGTCSGLSSKDYFAKSAQAFQGIRIPPRYKAPQQQITVSPDELRRDFAAANPKFGDRGIVVLCSGNGRYLQEVRACLTKELEARPCTAEVLRSACKSERIIMRPVR